MKDLKIKSWNFSDIKDKNVQPVILMKQSIDNIGKSYRLEKGIIWVGPKYNMDSENSKKLNLEIAKRLISQNNIDFQDNEGTTVLILATEWNNIKLVKYLIKAGANLELQNKYGKSALSIASYHGFTEIVKLLIKYNADLESTSNYGTPLIMAINHDNKKIIKMLIEAGASWINNSEHNPDLIDHMTLFKSEDSYRRVAKLIKKYPYKYANYLEMKKLQS